MHPMRLAALLVLVPLIFAGCATPPAAHSCAVPDEECDDVAIQLDEIPTRDLDHGADSGVGEATRRVIDDEQAWAAFWADHTRRQDPADPLPAVDFERERVVAIVLGSKPDGCYGVEITRAYGDEETVNVALTVEEPDADAVCPEIVTNPYHFVAIPHGGEVIFVDTQA